MAKPTKPQDVSNYKHDDAKRTMIPTAEQQGFVQEDEAKPIKLRYPRNPDLDPQMVWRGKDAEDATDLFIDAPPVYIQEKIHPRVIIERLKRDTAQRTEAAADIPDLFADFNGRPKDIEARTEFYQHEQNWQNRMILGDALMVMASLAERENLRGQVQCIYMDPPYGIKFNSNWQAKVFDTKVKDGSASHVSREPEVIRAFRDTWKDGINSYLSYLRDRLTVAKELLRDTGSVFVQIGDENVHRVRALMDEIFGEANFVSQIVLKTTSGAGSPSGGTLTLAGVYDSVVWYAKSKPHIKYHQLYFEKSEMASASLYKRIFDVTDLARSATDDELTGRKKLAGSEDFFRPDNLTSQSSPDSATFKVNWFGISAGPGKGGWKTNETGMARLKAGSRLYLTEKGSFQYIRKLKDFDAAPINNVWTDVGTGSFTADKVYIVQSNTKILERCILMTTDPGDIVLDPTCGSGTSAYVAEQWGRRWITIDTSRVALTLARTRLMAARYPFYMLRDSAAGQAKEADLTGIPPADIKPGNLLHNGFVYTRVPHIQLKDIANNSQIDDLWAKLNPAVQDALAALNASLAGQADPFAVTNGGRSGKTIDFTATGNVKLPSGEPAPANGFMEWEVPRTPGTPWPAKQQSLHSMARSWSATSTPAKRNAAEQALADLNTARSMSWTRETLPEAPITPWPAVAEDALQTFWTARITRQREIDASIEREGKRNAEYLYDKPHEDPKITRVAGPFTVESLSPYRVIPTDDDPRILDALRGDDGELPRRVVPQEQTDFATVVMEHLKSAGVQNTKKDERLRFDSMEPWPGKGYVAYEGRYTENGATRRAAIAIGPEYDAVGYEFVRNAAREARDAFDILIVCGFQFAPEVDDSMLNLGRLKVMKARMNQDIRMGDKLKNTGAGNLFVVFGEPDIRVTYPSDGMVQVEIKGVDIFDPTTGEVKSSDKPSDDIACWFIDDDYDEESFFVRQAYFLGGAAGDPYKALKRALKAEIDEEAWATLHTTQSHQFPKPESGQICVKVINHFGDEVQKVFKV
jgi:adenine-specific DNA-methyltransferase